ncbi:MAG: sulfatase [Promethearchaeota archaeon]
MLFVLVDDLGWADLGCQGSEFHETPNVDRLAREGARFTRAYAACPVCSPTRASLMTGKYPARVGVTQWIGGGFRGRVVGAPYLHYLPPGEKSLAAALRGAGYRTYHVGKWHLGDEPYWPEHHGFDINVAGCHMGHPWKGYFSPYGIPTIEDGPEGEYLTDRLTSEAIRLMGECADRGDVPFFVYLSYYSVHTPIQAPGELVEHYRRRASELGLDGVDPFRKERVDFVVERNFSGPYRTDGFGSDLHRLDFVDRRVVQSDATYAAMVNRLDWNVGRVLDFLDARGLAGDTVVFFYSDNGGLSDGVRPPTCNAPLRNGKSYVYEGGIRVPLLVRWPGVVPGGATCGVPVTTPDLYPTLLECCGLPADPDQHRDGVSFHRLLLDPGADATRGPVFWHYPHYNSNAARPASVVVDGDWKLIEWLEDGALELYHLGRDPGETTDLSGREGVVTARLLALLRSWRGEVGAAMPEPNPRYHLYSARVRIACTGKIVVGGGGDVLVETRLSPASPAVTGVPLGELLEEFLEQTVLLDACGEKTLGRLSVGGDGVPVFHETHGERTRPLADLLAGLDGSTVEVQAWGQFPEGAARENPGLVPLVELRTLLASRGPSNT